MKTFTAVSSITYQGKLILLCSSKGNSIYNRHGLTFDQAIDFLFSLRHAKGKDEVIICYAFQSDNEFLFSQLPSDMKDRLFQSHSIRGLREDLESELDDIEYEFFQTPTDSQRFEELSFNKHVNELALKESVDVNHSGYDIRLINGKLLTLNKDHKRLIIYDVYGFFRKPLRQAVNSWLSQDIEKLDRKATLSNSLSLKQIKAYAFFEARHIVKLMTRLNEMLLENDIKLSKFHGVTTITSWLLASYKARDEYHSYKRRRQYSGESYKAVMQSYYGGRVEQLKIGTFDKVYVYDINSAYAYAASQLPKMLHKPTFTDEWNNETFSMWFCEYDFTDIKPYFGLLPNRDTGSSIKFKLRGRGYFWQSEIEWILTHFPECIRIKYGYYIPYEKAGFTDGIHKLYKLRKELQKQKSPLETVIKLSLSAIYGKFDQRDGYAFYHNKFYAGFITAITRTQMLDLAIKKPEAVICFLTDAIHTTEKFDVEENDDLGGWKCTEYDRAEYIDAGIYRLSQNGKAVKLKTKGFRVFDFDGALQELQGFRRYTAMTEFFIGHNLFSSFPMHFKDYLKLQNEKKETRPFDSIGRVFNFGEIDFTKTYCDSKIIDLDNGRESVLYRAKHFRESDASKDSLIAGKI